MVAPRAGVGNEGVGPNPLGSPPKVGSAPSSSIYEPVGGWLADFVSHWLHTTDDTYVLRTDSEGIHLEFLERPPFAESRIMPPCGGDGHQGGPRTGHATISRLLEQTLLGANSYSKLFLGYKSKASKSLYKEGEVQDGDYQVYPESVVSR